MKVRLIILAVLALMAVGFVFLRGPIPSIALAAETLTTVGGVKITNTMVTSWVVLVLVLLGLLFIAGRQWTLVPGGVQNFVEAIFEAFYNIVISIAGEKNGRKFFPAVATIFFFVLINNWVALTPVFKQVGFFGHKTPVEEQLAADGYIHGVIFDEVEIGPLDLHLIPFSGPGNLGVTDDSRKIKEGAPESHDKYDAAVEAGKPVGDLIPLFRGTTTDLNTPLAIAIWSAIFVQFWGITALGLFKYGGKFIRLSSPIDFFVGLLEFVSEMVRLVSFTARLFGNMFAGTVVILMFTFLTPLVLPLPFYGLEIFVGLIQALIFASLTLVFAVMAVQSHDDHGAHAPGHTGTDKHEAIAEPA